MKIDSFANLVATQCGGQMVSEGVNGKLVSIEPISIATILMTVIPQVLAWFKSCKKKDNDSVQPSVAEDHADPRKSQKQRDRLTAKLKQLCKNGMKEEIRRAKATGVPADIGRYALTNDSLTRLADKSIAAFVSLPPKNAAALCASAGEQA